MKTVTPITTIQIPKAFSNFLPTVKAELVRGKVRRHLKLTNHHGEATKFLKFPATELASPEKFRAWCLNQGNFVFMGGQIELNRLVTLISKATAFSTTKKPAKPATNHYLILGQLASGKTYLANSIQMGPATAVIDCDQIGKIWLRSALRKMNRTHVLIFVAPFMEEFTRHRVHKLGIRIARTIQLIKH